MEGDLSLEFPANDPTPTPQKTVDSSYCYLTLQNNAILHEKSTFVFEILNLLYKKYVRPKRRSFQELRNSHGSSRHSGSRSTKLSFSMSPKRRMKSLLI